MMTFCGKELRVKPVNPAAFVMALGYKLGNEDIMSNKELSHFLKRPRPKKILVVVSIQSVHCICWI